MGVLQRMRLNLHCPPPIVGFIVDLSWGLFDKSKSKKGTVNVAHHQFIVRFLSPIATFLTRCCMKGFHHILLMLKKNTVQFVLIMKHSNMGHGKLNSTQQLHHCEKHTPNSMSYYNISE